MKKATELRPIEIIRNFTKHAAGSVLIKWGDTWVLCTASVEEKVPPFLRDTGRGWVTAEYAMLPSSTGGGRKDRDIKKLKMDARSSEIQRLIGRALRAAVDMSVLGERQITIDCDVLQADGGTRTAAITGAYVALADAVTDARERGLLSDAARPLTGSIAAVSVGTSSGRSPISPHATRSSACGLSAASRHPIGRAEPCVGPLPSMPTTASQMHSRGLQYSHRSTIMFAKSSIFGYL